MRHLLLGTLLGIAAVAFGRPTVAAANQAPGYVCTVQSLVAGTCKPAICTGFMCPMSERAAAGQPSGIIGNGCPPPSAGEPCDPMPIQIPPRVCASHTCVQNVRSQPSAAPADASGNPLGGIENAIRNAIWMLEHPCPYCAPP